MEKTKLTPGNIVILAAGAIMLIASFLAFYELGDESRSAWSNDFPGGMPISLIPVLCGVAMAAHVALTAFANVKLPERVLGLTWSQIHLALGFQAAIMMLCYLIKEKFFLDFGIGYWLMLLSGIALIVGAVLREREAAPAT